MVKAKAVVWYFVAWIVLTALCIAFVDRAASSWSYTHLHAMRMSTADWATHLVDPLPALAVAALLVIGLRALGSDWRPVGGWRTLMIGALAVMVAIALKEQLKYVFGRTWPETWVNGNPSWIRDGVYGFHFLHGGAGWASFPSGHMTAMSAVSGTLWTRLPKWRWLAILLCLLVAGGLFACDYHYIGDMVAGTFLGTGTALGVVRLFGGEGDELAA